jgi:Domain of unknown function (DUF1995)
VQYPALMKTTHHTHLFDILRVTYDFSPVYTLFYPMVLPILGARNLRKDLLATFVTSYQLKTMKTGAVVREWPAGYSVWNEDASVPEGYTLLETYAKEPPRELVDALYDVSTPCVNTYMYVRIVYTCAQTTHYVSVDIAIHVSVSSSTTNALHLHAIAIIPVSSPCIKTTTLLI